MSDRTVTRDPQHLFPIATEDLLKLKIEARFIPFVVLTTLRVEQSPHESTTLTTTEAETLVEILDKTLSSDTVNPSSKNRCLKVMRRVSSVHGILPKSYYLAGVALRGTRYCAPDGITNAWEGDLEGRCVCVKTYRTHEGMWLDKIKERLYREIVRWKYASHPNLVSFLGISSTLFPICFINACPLNGNIIEYTRENQGVNKFQLLAQAASGLVYLHSLSIVHSHINPANLLIGEDGIARLGGFAIMNVITYPTDMEPGSMITSKPSVVRYMAPELLDPPQFNLPDSNPSKWSDVYSFAMTAYETLAEIRPYGCVPSGNIIPRVLAGDRPHRPMNSQWLPERIWGMIRICWSEKRKLRWDIRAVCEQLSLPSVQGVPGHQQDTQITTQRLRTAEDAPPDSRAQTSVRVRNQPGQRLVNFIDKMLEDGEVPFEDQPEFLNTLGKVCRQFKTIPDSMRLKVDLDGQMDEVAHGGCATIFRGKYQGITVAVKTIHQYSSHGPEEYFSKFRREVVAWRHLQHPNILPLIGVILEKRKFVMVSEWMELGNINDFVKNYEGVNRVQLLVDVASGLEYMHRINMVHGDLKGANILINEGMRACLADFGLTTIVGVGCHSGDNTSLLSVASEASLISFTSGGTIRWMSPELLYPEQFGITDCRPTKQSDCYALGMVIYEVLCGNPPYQEISNEAALICAIMRGDRPQKPEGAEALGFSEGLWATVERCWLADVAERPDVKGISFQLNHAAWFWKRRRLI